MTNRPFQIVSCVGERPLAVASPLASLIRGKAWKGEEVAVLLLTTARTEGHADAIARWLQGRFPGLEVQREDFCMDDPHWLPMMPPDAAVFFHCNPGMNWQIARLVMNLPGERTSLIYADFEQVHIWPLGEDISSNRKETFHLEDLGLAAYNTLSPELRVETAAVSPCRRACTRLRRKMICRAGDRGTTARGATFFHVEDTRGRDLPPSVKREILSRLLWVRERRGLLHLLFDLRKKRRLCYYSDKCKAAPPPENGEQRQGDKTPPELLDLTRLLLALFPSLSYRLTVATDDEATCNRCHIEGIHCLFGTTEEELLPLLEDWVAGKGLPGTKRLPPVAETPSVTPEAPTPGVTNLFCAVGDNPDPTIQAVRAHQPCHARLFFDAETPRLKDQALRLQAMFAKEFPGRSFPLLATDHLGSDIVTRLGRFAGPFVVNITPGTKAQGVALAVSARRAGVRAYSLDKGRLVNLHDAADHRPVPATRLEDLLEAMPLPTESREEQGEEVKGLCCLILRELAGGRLTPKWSEPDKLEHLLLKTSKEPAFEVTPRGLEYRGKNRRVFPGGQDLWDRMRAGGVWWEEVTARAIGDALGVSVKRGLKWSRHSGTASVNHTEMDVVFPYKNHIVAVSCKSGKIDFPLEAFLIRAEAGARFGRFALPCIAVPYERRSMQRVPSGEAVSGALVLTPAVMVDKRRLQERLDAFIASLRTTVNGRKIGGHNT